MEIPMQVAIGWRYAYCRGIVVFGSGRSRLPCIFCINIFTIRQTSEKAENLKSRLNQPTNQLQTNANKKLFKKTFNHTLCAGHGISWSRMFKEGRLIRN